MEPKFDDWAIVELFGHLRLAGKVTEATIAGGAFLRVDVPDKETPKKFWTRYFGSSAIFSLTPTAEALARAVARQCDAEPVHQWDFPQIEASRQTDDFPT